MIPNAPTAVERRRRLATAVEQMALAIVNRELNARDELQALALICDDHQLTAETARVRRWIP